MKLPNFNYRLKSNNHIYIDKYCVDQGWTVNVTNDVATASNSQKTSYESNLITWDEKGQYSEKKNLHQILQTKSGGCINGSTLTWNQSNRSDFQ